MADIKNLETQIFNTFSEREVNSFIAKCRRITEGIILALIEHNNIETNSTFMLGNFTLDKTLMRKLNIDVNINSHINYIRLYGNRAIHYQEYTFSEYDVNLVRYSIDQIIFFFYKSVNKTIPKSIEKFLKHTKTQSRLSYSYNLDNDLYVDAIIAVENSERNFPRLGIDLISNILSKILIDIDGKINEEYFFVYNDKKYLGIDNVISFLRKEGRVPNEIVSKIDELQTFFRNSKKLLREDKKVPEVPETVKTSIVDITDWFFKKDGLNTNPTNIRIVPFFIDIFTLLVFFTSVLSGIMVTRYTEFVIHPIFSLFVFLGVLAFSFSFIYNIMYSFSPSIRNKRAFNVSKIISSFSGVVGVLIFYIIARGILTDGLPDKPYFVYFMSTATWTVFLQFSIFFNNNSKSFIDISLRLISILFLFISLYLLYIYTPMFMNG